MTFFGPPRTNPIIRMFLWTLVSVALVSAIVTQFTKLPLVVYLSLSPWGILQGFVWQFVTYLLIVPNPLSFFFVIYLAFVLYLIWVIGTSLIDRVGQTAFVKFFITTGLLSGICALIVSFLTTGAPLAGITCIVYGMLVSWATFYPDMRMLLFLIFPVKAKWLVTGLLALTIFFDISAFNWIPLTANVVGAATGFLYTQFFWIRERTPKRSSPEDQEFVERMLTKISLQGKESLTWRERWKMNRISKRRR